jgi:glutamate/aspartate transport system substrate-binding protein
MLRFLLAVALTASLLAIPAARAQELTGTLKKTKDSKTVTLGYRESSIPFSYVNKVGDPIGYSIDLCNAVVDEVSKELEGVEIAVNYKKVTAETRIPTVKSGEVDLECGSTTANFERKKEVAFSPIFFVAGTKLLVPRSSAIGSYRDLRDKTVVVTAGTTNEAAVRAISDKQHLGIRFLVGRQRPRRIICHAEGRQG